jgi:hypothetical protein
MTVTLWRSAKSLFPDNRGVSPVPRSNYVSKSELLESNGSSVTLFQLSALQRIEHLEYLKQLEAVEEGDFQAAITLTVKSGAYLWRCRSGTTTH